MKLRRALQLIRHALHPRRPRRLRRPTADAGPATRTRLPGTPTAATPATPRAIAAAPTGADEVRTRVQLRALLDHTPNHRGAAS
jgi:hypothetical protein